MVTMAKEASAFINSGVQPTQSAATPATAAIMTLKKSTHRIGPAMLAAPILTAALLTDGREQEVNSARQASLYRRGANSSLSRGAPVGRTKFRIMIGLIAFAHLVAASELGGLLGFVAIWALIFAVVPVGIVASFFPGLDLPAWAPAAVLGAVGLGFAAGAARQLMRAGAARRTGDHDGARRRAAAGLLIVSVPTCFLLSVKALADAWP